MTPISEVEKLFSAVRVNLELGLSYGTAIKEAIEATQGVVATDEMIAGVKRALVESARVIHAVLSSIEV